LLLLHPASARHLTSLLLADESDPGSDNGNEHLAARMSSLETSALAEVGNLMVSYFLNKVAAALGRPRLLYPSPPALMTDMLGAMLDVIATPVAATSDDLLVIACGLATGGEEKEARLIQVHFWILPEPATRIIGIA
jgi:chemotaxis protein CheC